MCVISRLGGLLATIGLVAVAACGGGDPKLVLRITYDVDGQPLETAAVMQRRLDRLHVAGTARAQGDRVVVELPALDEEELRRTEDCLVRIGRLELHAVDSDAAVMRRLADHVAGDAGAAALGIRVVPMTWMWSRGDGPLREDVALAADDRQQVVSPQEARKLGCRVDAASCTVPGREILRRYLASLADPALAIPDDRELVFEPIRSSWRSYYVVRAPIVDSAAVRAAALGASSDPDHPRVLVTLDDDGGRRFGDWTAAHVGDKLAIVLDGRVTSAPVIDAAIPNGRLGLSIGPSDPAAGRRAAHDLAVVLATGPLPRPVVEDSAQLIR